jgi:chromosome segregation ATPase
MSSSREVKKVLSRFTKHIKRANEDIEDVLETIHELEEALESYNADEDLTITRGIKGEIKRGKKQIERLRENVDKLDNELSDTSRKYYYLSN